MNNVRYFELGDLLTITTGRLVAKRHMEAVYDILNFLTGDSLFTHQLGRGMEECAPWILKQHPQLSGVDASSVGPANHRDWLDSMIQKYGDSFALTPMPREMHTKIDPLTELEAMVGDKKKIIVV